MNFSGDFAAPALRLHDAGDSDKAAACLRSHAQGLKPAPLSNLRGAAAALPRALDATRPPLIDDLERIPLPRAQPGRAY